MQRLKAKRHDGGPGGDLEKKVIQTKLVTMQVKVSSPSQELFEGGRESGTWMLIGCHNQEGGGSRKMPRRGSRILS